MSSKRKIAINEKLQYMDITRDPTPGYVSGLEWWTETKGAVRALMNMISGAWRMVMAPIRGTWRIGNLGLEKLKSIFTGRKPNYDKVMSRSRRAFLKRSKEYRERQEKAALYKKDGKPPPPPDQESQEQKWAEEERAKTGWTVRGSTKSWLRSKGLPTIKESFVHVDYDLSFILNEDQTYSIELQEILDGIREDYQEIKSLYEIATSPSSNISDIGNLIRAVGFEDLEDSDIDFYALASTLDPEMPEEQRQWIGQETLNQIRSRILPRYISEMDKAVKKSLKTMARAYLTPDESFVVENLLSTLSFK